MGKLEGMYHFNETPDSFIFRSVTFNSVFPGNFSIRKFALEAFHSRAVLSRSRMKRDCTGNNI